MTCMYQKLKHTHNQFVSKLLTEEQRSSYSLQLVTKNLHLPGLEPPTDNTEDVNSKKQSNRKGVRLNDDNEPKEETKDEAVDVTDDSFAEGKEGDFSAIPQL